MCFGVISPRYMGSTLRAIPARTEDKEKFRQKEGKIVLPDDWFHFSISAQACANYSLGHIALKLVKL